MEMLIATVVGLLLGALLLATLSWAGAHVPPQQRGDLGP